MQDMIFIKNDFLEWVENAANPKIVYLAYSAKKRRTRYKNFMRLKKDYKHERK